MKYLTKEWYRLCQMTDLEFDFTVLDKTDKQEENLFLKLYQKEEAAFIKQERELHDQDPREEKNTDSLLFDLLFSDLSSDEDAAILGQANEQMNQIMNEVDQALIEAFENRPPFDEAASKASFEMLYQEKLDSLSDRYPKAILAKVEDRQVFALGFCTKEIYEELSSYSKEAQLKVDLVLNSHIAIEQEQEIPEEITEHFGSHDALVTKAILDTTLTIELDNEGAFSNVRSYHFKDAKILKQDAPLEGAIWLYDELYRIEDGYEVHILFQGDHLIDLILTCTDIILKLEEQ